MATKELTVTWCDQHLLEGVEVPGTSRALSLDGLMGTVDLCDPCFKELTAKLLFLLEGQQPAMNAKDLETKRTRMGPRYFGQRKWVCLLCQEEYAANSGLRYHFTTAHGIAEGVQEVYGDVCPLDGEHMGHGRQSATLHARDRHRANNVSKLFERAAKKGDPYGVIQGRIEALES